MENLIKKLRYSFDWDQRFSGSIARDIQMGKRTFGTFNIHFDGYFSSDYNANLFTGPD